MKLKDSFVRSVLDVAGNENVKIDELMKNHTSFKVGGPADLLVYPSNYEMVKELIKICKENKVDYFILGNGSNLIIRDGGIRGVVIKLGHINKLVIDNEGNIRELSKEELEFGYRNSTILKYGYIVLETRMRLSHGDKALIKERMDDLSERRKSKQPLEYASAGSTFKRPEGYFAGKLIQDSGLKGTSVGDAQVSEKHSGFIINRGNATSRDILDLIEVVKAKVYEKFKVELHTEVRVIGEDSLT